MRQSKKPFLWGDPDELIVDFEPCRPECKQLHQELEDLYEMNRHLREEARSARGQLQNWKVSFWCMAYVGIGIVLIEWIW